MSLNWNGKVLSLDQKNLEECSAYFEKVENRGVYHSPDYVKVLSKHYDAEAKLFIFGDEENFIYYPFFLRKLDKLPFAKNCELDLSKYFDITSSWYYGGPLLEVKQPAHEKSLVSQFIDSFHNYCLSNNIIAEFVRYDPYLENHKPFINLLEIKKNRDVVYLDLTQDINAIWNNFKHCNRKNIKKAQRSGIYIYHSENNNDDITKFYEIYILEMNRKNAISQFFFSEDNIKDLFAQLKDGVELFIAKYGEEIVGGTIFLYSNRTAHDHLRASLPKYWPYRVNNLLLYEALLWAKKQGIKNFSFQGGREGVYKFKLTFSETTKDFYINSIIHKSYEYNLLCSSKDKWDIATKGYKTGNQDFFPYYRKEDDRRFTRNQNDTAGA